MSIIDLIVDILLQFVGTLGLLFVVGFIITFCNKKFYSYLSDKSHALCIFTGFIGTPIHELSHALMCIIFGHKISEIKFFTPNCKDGVLGYVCHTWNPKSFYQKLGNFFIGVAPILVGSTLLITILRLLLPDLYNSIIIHFWNIDINNIEEIGVAFGNIFSEIFKCFTTWQWWVFVLIGFFIALHMTLSKEDIQGASTGLVFFILLIIVINIVLYFVDSNIVTKITSQILSLAVLLLCFFSIIIVLMLTLVLFAYVYQLIRKRC